MTSTTAPITLDELDSALNEPAGQRMPRAAWVQRMVDGSGPAVDDDTLCEVACERDPAGPLSTIQGLLGGLLIRHAGDAATVAALMAIRAYHLPDLVQRGA